ncbi:uncharacterized protein F4817DRAFT_268505 [Daldinia loculata]|uniref:uncharacterized protein n=1 Tax=Daldinia loculata TaxID=103429 RepID=UPI0020C32485|nr:uncharacterized protein F4817DRAFT_268505 [Daldinia loculata]KAI1643153.1 hypothetical protein F4817DRAFT_268505 [Daldinia loculata]
MATIYLVHVPVSTDNNTNNILFEWMFYTTVFCLSTLAWVDYCRWASYPLVPQRRQVVDEIVEMAPPCPDSLGLVWMLCAYMWCHCKFIGLPSIMTTHTFRGNPTPLEHVPKRLPVIVAEYWSGITMLALILQLQVYLWWVRVALVAEEAHGTHDKGFATLGPYTQLLVRRALSVFVS